MTVEVETPEGLKTGSAVREVKVVIAHPEIQGLNDTRAFVKGEAVVIDLGKRGLLFALMHPDDSYRVVFEAFPGPPGLTMEGLEYYAHLKNVSAIIEPGSIPDPNFVTFKNIADPKSIWPVDSKNMSSLFGKGIKLKQISIQMTDEPITHVIEDIIPPFLPKLGFQDWYRKLDYQDKRRVDRSQFITR